FILLSFKVAAVNGCSNPATVVFRMPAAQTPILMSLRTMEKIAHSPAVLCKKMDMNTVKQGGMQN
ncbi:MAG TPA: hypothetical protein DHO02_10750, partial [Syntrophaceae bacterium]|nr:hypothetical protein [Syntrophaceae bacterium]